jgi:uncharacterized membrane protein
MSTSAWRFTGTEGADDAVVKLKGLDAQDLIDVQDLAVIRWPRWAAAPIVQDHVTDEGNRVSGLVGRFKHAAIDSSMIEAAKGDMTSGTSAIVLLSANADVDAVAGVFTGLGKDIELIRTDLSVPEQDRLRAAISHAIDPGQRPAPQTPQ